MNCCERNNVNCRQGRECPERLGGGNFWPREQAVMPTVEETEAWVGVALWIVAGSLAAITVMAMLA